MEDISSVSTVVFIDSGIGGLPYCDFFMKRNSQVNTVYIADRAHFPYGKKTKEELVALLIELAGDAIRAFNPVMIVLACNTASVSALTELRKNFPGMLFVGTVPAVKPAILASKAGHIGVLGTERTIDDPCIKKIARETQRETHTRCKIAKITAPDLVDFVEHLLPDANVNEKNTITKKYVTIFRALGVDGIVLGCTHFLFLLDEFKRNAAPDIIMYDSIEGVCHQIEILLRDTVSTKASLTERLPEDTKKEANLLLVTGSGGMEKKWEQIAARFHLVPGTFATEQNPGA
jgi:glutamate racemase